MGVLFACVFAVELQASAIETGACLEEPWPQGFPLGISSLGFLLGLMDSFSKHLGACKRPGTAAGMYQ